VAGGDKGDLGLPCVGRGEADRELGSLSIAGLDGGLAGIRRGAALSTVKFFVESHGGSDRSGCGRSLSILGCPRGVGGRSKVNAFEAELFVFAIVFGTGVETQCAIFRRAV
jgi:hypothetical protein